ncbi:DAZ-associated protein 2-like isoform X1 [Dysidea avara]|uniref:DAZ-associated protein 2-like isoform X1 n=1 Tax=Dysidea avara TaxID=196820 RepID=UPI003320DBDD
MSGKSGPPQPSAPPHPSHAPPPYSIQPVQSPATYPGQRTQKPSVTVQGQYAAGARFDPNKPATIPPPPPGVAPTPAQIAAAQGKPVVMTQQKASSMMGEDGGATWSGLM